MSKKNLLDWFLERQYEGCPYCGGSLDGNGDCANYCESGLCGRCGESVPRHSEHLCADRIGAVLASAGFKVTVK